jgi:putative heme iron utilization protein
MAVHTQNLNADPRASLFITQAAGDNDPLGAARVTIMGQATEIADEDLAAARTIYLAKHENSRYWVDFEDFRFFRLERATSTMSVALVSWGGWMRGNMKRLLQIPCYRQRRELSRM